MSKAAKRELVHFYALTTTASMCGEENEIIKLAKQSSYVAGVTFQESVHEQIAAFRMAPSSNTAAPTDPSGACTHCEPARHGVQCTARRATRPQRPICTQSPHNAIEEHTPVV